MPWLAEGSVGGGAAKEAASRASHAGRRDGRMGKWVIVVLILLFGGGGYYGHNRYGAWPRYWSSAHDYRRAVLLGCLQGLNFNRP